MASWPTKKQPIVASQAVVAANQPIAAAAGISMLAAGGTVADAAVATVFVCSVVEPQMVGPLGGGYAVYRDANGDTFAIDNYAEGPGSVTDTLYTPDPAAGPGMVKDDANNTGYLASGIPGNLKGWLHLHALRGKLPLAQVLAPAIAAAEYGFPLSTYLQWSFEQTKTQLGMFPETARIFLPGGKPPAVGDTFRNPEMADSLRLIARDGADALYHGPIGEALVKDMAANGGNITQADLDQYEVREPDPVRGAYRGYTISAAPLSSGGGLLNQLGLNILENFDLPSMGFPSARYWHLLIETLKIMFADRAKYLGDPKFIDVPQEQLLDKDYARRRAHEIKLDRPQQYAAGDVSTGSGGHTTHLTVMAADGSTVTMTTTLNNSFGGRVVVPGTGLLTNNNMALFDPYPGRPNSVGPYKRMLTATAASIIEQNGQPLFAIGTPGGIRIFPTVLQGILNVLDHGLSLQEAVEAPRLWCNGPILEIESIAPKPVLAELERMGHPITLVPAIANCMNGVYRDPATGLLHGANCWRGDGAPAGLSGGYAENRNDWW